VYWKGFEPSKLLDYDSRLVTFTQELSFQEGRPLSSITEKEYVTQSYSTIALGLITRRIIKSA
jgi:hypothetical protein